VGFSEKEPPDQTPHRGTTGARGKEQVSAYSELGLGDLGEGAGMLFSSFEVFLVERVLGGGGGGWGLACSKRGIATARNRPGRKPGGYLLVKKGWKQKFRWGKKGRKRDWGQGMSLWRLLLGGGQLLKAGCGDFRGVRPTRTVCYQSFRVKTSPSGNYTISFETLRRKLIGTLKCLVTSFSGRGGLSGQFASGA